MDSFRGYEITKKNGYYIFVDNEESVAATWESRPCGFCGKHNTIEGHDACLGTIKGPILNACCGHGIQKDAYIQFIEGTIRGSKVFEFINRELNEKT